MNATDESEVRELQHQKAVLLNQLKNRHAEIDMLKKKNRELNKAIELFVAKFDAVDWGWDGDCGSYYLVRELERAIK